MQNIAKWGKSDRNFVICKNVRVVLEMSFVQLTNIQIAKFQMFLTEKN